VEDPTERPIARAALTLIDHSGHQTARARTRDDGSYTLPRPQPGSYMLVVSAEGHQPQAIELTIGERPTSCTVTLQPVGMLAGTVRHGPTGRPVADARITLLDADGIPVATATTTGDGTYTLTGLTPGAYTLVAGGYPPVATTVALRGADATTVDLELTQRAE
jgi:uncharacterized surface anchored protein